MPNKLCPTCKGYKWLMYANGKPPENPEDQHRDLFMCYTCNAAGFIPEEEERTDD